MRLNSSALIGGLHFRVILVFETYITVGMSSLQDDKLIKRQNNQTYTNAVERLSSCMMRSFRPVSSVWQCMLNHTITQSKRILKAIYSRKRSLTGYGRDVLSGGKQTSSKRVTSISVFQYFWCIHQMVFVSHSVYTQTCVTARTCIY